MSNKSKNPSGKKAKNPAEVAAALKQMQLSVPQWMAMMEEMKITNLKLKVANNALITEFNKTFEAIGARIEAIEVKVFGKVQGEIPTSPGVSTDAMTLPTAQATKDAALLKKIQTVEKVVEPDGEDTGEPKSAVSVPLGYSGEDAADEDEGTDDAISNEVGDDDDLTDPAVTSMFPKA